MKIASIDIGTNAIKSKVFNTSPTSIEFIEGIRSPIRPVSYTHLTLPTTD